MQRVTASFDHHRYAASNYFVSSRVRFAQVPPWHSFPYYLRIRPKWELLTIDRSCALTKALLEIIMTNGILQIPVMMYWGT